MKRTLTILLACASLLHAEVKVSVAGVNDQRSDGSFSGSLDIALILSGPELKNARRIRVKLESATDETGRNLLKDSDEIFDEGFMTFKRPTSDRSKGGNDAFEIEIGLKNPAREAKTVKNITGVIELLVPSNDPESIITASPTKDAGKPLDNPALKAISTKITLLTKATGVLATKKRNGRNQTDDDSSIGDAQLGYKLSGSKGAVADVEFCSASGQALKTVKGVYSFGDEKSDTFIASFRDKPPADAVAKIYLLTEKSLVKIPLNLTAVPLP